MIERGVIASLITISAIGGVRAQVQQANIALHKPVIVSSEDKSFPALKITDGIISRTSKWQAGTNKAPHTVEIDLRKYYNITGITVHSGITDQEKKPDEMTQAAGFWSVKNFKLQYWDDANWTDIPKAEVHENRLVAATFQFKPAVTTYKIRLVCDDGEPINIMEIEAFGQEAPNMPAPPTVTQTAVKAQKASGVQKAVVTVSNKVIGKSLKYVGYNQGYYFPDSNISGWLEYSNVNSLRVWATLNAFVPANTVQVDKGVNTVEEFDKRKNELRTSPEKNRFIKWEQLTPLYDKPDSSSTNAMVYNYALTELKRLGIDVILQIGSTDFSDDWTNKWMQWQRYYALAYHSAKVGDVAMFAMQNEPNHKNSGPMKLDQWISGAQIVSDAIHCAVEDVNKAYGKHLQGKFVGPVTAGQNTDWWAAVAKAIHTDYHGKTVGTNMVDLFSTHSYNSPAAGYASRISNIRKVLEENHPEGKSIPIMYTEIGRWMNAYLIDKDETMDSPSLFTEWAGIYANNMKNGGYGMWAFKFANTASGPYSRGIKSGHHYIWQGKRIVEDAHQNLALNKPVKSSTALNLGKLITDGVKTDNSAWQSGSGTEKEKWLEIDLGTPQELGSAVVYTGSADGVYTSPDRIKNFKLQYWDNSWKDIPGMEEKASKYSQIYNVFTEPVKTSKVRFVSNDAGNLKVREIKLFAKGDEPSTAPDYNVSGIQRTGEVVRLFAKGFKNERNLLQTTTLVPDDTDLDTYTSFDEATGNYYMWLVQRSLQSYQLNVNLASLKIAAGTPITAETVNGNNYGEVTQVMNLPQTGQLNLTLAPQSVVLLTIPSNIKPVATTIKTAAMVSVRGGSSASKNYSSAVNTRVQLDAACKENNQVAYIHFNLPAGKATTAKRSIFAISGRVNTGSKPYRLHVYAIPQNTAFNAKELTWNSAPELDTNEALIKNVGSKAFVAGEIAFNTAEKYHYLDVTDLMKKHAGNGITFVLVRETRQIGDDEDKGRVVTLSSTVAGPQLKIWQ